MNIGLPIPAGTIQRIKQLSHGHPVFLVTLTGGACVIKSEGGGNIRTSQLANPIEIMNAIDAHAPTRVLGPKEMMAIRTWVQGHAADVEEGNAGYLASELAAALRPPMPGQGPQYTRVFIVMQAKQNLTDLESEGLKGMGRDADGTITVRDKTGVKALHQVFKQPGVLEKLGEIVAADAFNGNQDRVNFNGTGKKWDGQMLLCLQNPGNIFVGDGGGALTVLGLDVFDPYGSFKDWGTLNEGAEAYPGRILRTDAGAKRLELTRKLAADIERILGPRNRTFAFQKQTRLPVDAVARINRGLETGAAKVLAFMKQKYVGGKIPIGIQLRLKACGWLTPQQFPKV